MGSKLEMRGAPPSLAGQVCEEFWCDEMWYTNAQENLDLLVDAALSIFIRANARWHRLAFDAEIVFWSELPHEPGDPDPDADPQFRFPRSDLGSHFSLKGQVIEAVQCLPFTDGARVAFQFAHGPKLVFTHEKDETHYALLP